MSKFTPEEMEQFFFAALINGGTDRTKYFKFRKHVFGDRLSYGLNPDGSIGVGIRPTHPLAVDAYLTWVQQQQDRRKA